MDEVSDGRREPAILVVDDHAPNLVAIEAALGEQGVELVRADSGQDALRLLLERDFALILLDVQMPGMDGFETAELIRTRQRTRHVPIIFVTAYGRDDAAMLRGYRLGAVDFLFKPIVAEVLQAKVDVFVELRRQAERLQDLERKNQERRITEARQRWEADALRTENERKDEFIAMLAHELRNPLMPIVTAVALLEGEPAPEVIAHAREVMRRQLETLRRLVDDLLDIARITSGKINLKRERMDARVVVEMAVDANRFDIDARNQEIQMVLPEQPVWIQGDRVRLTQVVSNLIGNASRYTPEEGHIGVTLKRDPTGAHFLVADDGCGIEPEVLPRIFDLFVQERDGGHGLGLGLSLVKRLVDLHDGSVAVRSQGRDQGSVFEVVVPVRSSLRDTGTIARVASGPPTSVGGEWGPDAGASHRRRGRHSTDHGDAAAVLGLCGHRRRGPSVRHR